MNIKYYHWLSIGVTHNYFKNGACPSCSLLPLRDTASILKNHKIVINADESGFHFYKGVEESNSFDMPTEFSDLGKLTFQLLNSDPLFFNYTVPNLIGQEYLFFFTNRDNSGVLHSSEFVSEEDIRTVRSTAFSSETVEIRNAPGDVISSVASETLSEACIGIVQIDIQKLISDASEAVKQTINFNSRAVFCEYVVLVAASRNLEVTSIEIKADGSERYNKQAEGVIVNGQKAQVFLSNNPIPLKQELEKHPVLHLTYTSDQSNGETDLDIKLPNAGFENLERRNNETGDTIIVSSNIIYV